MNIKKLIVIVIIIIIIVIAVVGFKQYKNSKRADIKIPILLYHDFVTAVPDMELICRYMI